MKAICQHCKNNFKFSPSKSTGKFCSNKCQQGYQWKHIVVPRIQRGECSTRKVLKRYLIEQKGAACTTCHGTKWRDKPMPIELDHIDGDAGNNMPSNLRLLCPNCHALTPTAKGKNRGNGRRARGLPVF